MTYRSLGRLEFCRKAVNFPPLEIPREACPLSQSSSVPNQRRRFHQFSHKEQKINPLTHYRPYCSHIVKSPFKEVEISNSLISEFVWESLDRFPESIAVKCGVTGRAYTYAQIRKLVERFAKSLLKAGFVRGEIIAVVTPNCPEYAVVTLGALEAELAVTFINHVYTPDEMCHQLKDSGCVCVVSASEKLDVVLSAITKVENATKSKPIRRVIALDIPSPEALPRGVTRYSEMVADGVDTTDKIISRVNVNELALLPYSSGTTGLSKGVGLSHRNIVANILQFSSIEGIQFRSPEIGQDLILGLLPFYHIYGLVVILLNTLRSGSQLVTLPKFEQDTFIRALENEKFSVMMLVPPLILFLGGSERVKSKHLAHVRQMMSGAAPLGASDLAKVRAKLPSKDHCLMHQGYGMTETSPVVTVPIPPAKDMDTVGAPIPNTLGKIINPENGEVLGPNQKGELCFKGPQVMLGYHNNPKATAEMIDADGWLRTGDIGYYDEDSHFYIQDRLKELIKVKGFQVPPAELEELLRTHPLVSDVGVIGVPHSRSGEVPVAYVVPKKDKKITGEQIKGFLSERVSAHKQVSEVIFIDTIPKSAAGKILRKELRLLYKDSQK